ncbi:hypothetical protein [Oceanobacillus kimchii]|uniref:hypothetical protein n=1 Tax=Oceanobacillus kimchii TaxID=746691 RepID=UPI003B014EE8
MLGKEFEHLVNEFGVPVNLNGDTRIRKAIITNQIISNTLPNFDDKSIHCTFEIKRGDIVVYEDVQYLIISDIQSKRAFEYKATMRPMTVSLTYTYYIREIIDYDRLGRPIYGEEEEVTSVIPCIAYQEGTPTLTSGQLIISETRIKVIMPDNEITQQLEETSEHTVLNHRYKIEDINLLQSGLRIFTMEWTQNPS